MQESGDDFVSWGYAVAFCSNFLHIIAIHGCKYAILFFCCCKYMYNCVLFFSFGCSKGALTVGLPPAWVDVSEEIAVNVQRARVKMSELSKAHAKALMPSFGDGKEDQRLIESLTQEITGLITKSQKRLQILSAAGPSEDSNVRKNVQV